MQRIKTSKLFPKSFRSFRRNINVKVDLSNYAKKVDIKNISHVDTSSFALKTDLANLKTEVYQLDIDKLVPVPTDLSKLSNVVKNDVVKNIVYDKLVTEVNAIPLNNIDTSDFVLKINYNTDKTELEKRIPNVTDFAIKTDCNTKINDIENRITDHNHNKYIDTPDFNKVAANVFNARLKQANLLTKTDFDVEMSNLNRKIASNQTKYVLV